MYACMRVCIEIYGGGLTPSSICSQCRREEDGGLADSQRHSGSLCALVAHFHHRRYRRGAHGTSRRRL